MKKLIILSCLTAIFFAASWSLFHPGLPKMHDSTHAARIAEMWRGLADGQLPVRWTPNFGYGYGMPLFEFYAPLPFFVGALFYGAGLNIEIVIKLLFIISTLFSMVGSYKVGSKLFGRAGGLICAAAFTLAPYRSVNLFVRGAVSEAWGMTALPWIVWSLVVLMERVKEKQPKQSMAWIFLTLSLIALMLSHNLTTLMFVPISGLLGLGYIAFASASQKISKTTFWKMFIYLVTAYLASIGATAFYTIPALSENTLTQIGGILGGYFHYSNHFLYIRQFLVPNWGYGGSEWGPNDGLSFFLGYGQFLGVMIAGLAWLKLSWSLARQMTKRMSFVSKIKLFVGNRQWWLGFLFQIFLVLGLYLTLLKSKWLWDMIPILPYIQFPWRWVSVGAIMAALLSGLSVSLVKAPMLRYGYAAVLFSLILINGIYFRPMLYLSQENEVYFTSPEQIQGLVSNILPDYIPKQMSGSISSGYRDDQGIWVSTTKTLPVVVITPAVQSDAFQILVNRGHQKLVSVQLSQVSQFNFNIADFPGWQVEIDGQKVAHQQGEIGNILVEVPQGEHKVGVYWADTPIRQFSDILSLLSGLGILAIFIGVSLLPQMARKNKT